MTLTTLLFRVDYENSPHRLVLIIATLKSYYIIRSRQLEPATFSNIAESSFIPSSEPGHFFSCGMQDFLQEPLHTFSHFTSNKTKKIYYFTYLIAFQARL